MTPTARTRYMAHPRGDVARRERQMAGALSEGVRLAVASVLLLGLLFGVPLAIGALAVALGMDPLAGVR